MAEDRDPILTIEGSIVVGANSIEAARGRALDVVRTSRTEIEAVHEL